MNRLLVPLLLGVAGGALLSSSCGPTRPPCTSTTCTGCCDSTGECRSGLDNSACGARGASCTQCGLVSTCLSGVCSLNNTGAGTAGGSSATGGGAAGGATAGGSAGGAVGQCNSNNCAGCCTDTAQCVAGFSPQACGTNGASCLVCGANQTCASGRCAGSVGGGAAGGGSAGGGPGGGAGSCNQTTCATGCCQGGTCQPPSVAQCGSNGNACVRCGTGQTCISGLCTACSGCINVSTGLCQVGTSNLACGRNGAVCADCGGGTCVNGTCSGGGCTSSTCPSGCCNGTACVQPANQSAGQCGRGPGMGGAACRACGTSETCDTVDGTCTPSGGVDGGLPPFPDGGLPPFPDGGFNFCFLGPECGPTECCFQVSGIGVCAGIGNPNLLGGTTCGVPQTPCGTSCVTGQTCALGTCL